MEEVLSGRLYVDMKRCLVVSLDNGQMCVNVREAADLGSSSVSALRPLQPVRKRLMLV